MPDELRIMIAAGGTGGHVFPAIAIADAIRETYPDSRFLFVGTRDRIEWKAVPAAGYDIVPIWISGFHRRLTLKNLLFPLKLLISLWQSRKHIRRFRPHAMVSCGGFAAGPPGWMAIRMSIPLFIQEQNSLPGVTNRKLASGAEYIFTAFEEAEKWFPSGKTVCLGNPVRSTLLDKVSDPGFARKALAHFKLDPDRPVLLVMGGSGGAKSINKAMMHHLAELHDTDGLQVIWQCGHTYYREIVRKLELDTVGEGWRKRYPGLRLYAFMDDVTEAWAAADIIVSRAGAITCSELLATGKAGILVPSPWVAGNHQTHNAKSLADKGAAVLLHDDALTDHLPDEIRSLVRDSDRRNQMELQARKMAKTDVASIIAKHILEYVRNRMKDRNIQSQPIKASA